MVTKKEDMANELNAHFINKIKKLKMHMPTPKTDILNQLKNTPTPKGDEMNLMSLTEADLNKIIKDLKKTTANGHDTINSIVIHDSYEATKQILLHGINLALATGKYPQQFKITKLVPQVKAGKDPQEAASYRPISNLNILGKIYEQAFFDQTAAFINSSNKLNKDQHGGRPGHSTTTCLVELWEQARKNVNNKEKTAILAIEMSAAYDLCCHKILVEKCRLLGIGKPAVKFLKSFLEKRSQYVELGGKTSTILQNGPFGAVQGGKSSGDLFLYYLNELPMQLLKKVNKKDQANSMGKEFVDDLSILARATSVEKLLTQLKFDYEKVNNFLIDHLMVINESKSQLMILFPPKNIGDLKLKLKNSQIPHQHNIKVLGVTLSDNMKWDDHLWKGSNNMAKTISNKIAVGVEGRGSGDDRREADTVIMTNRTKIHSSVLILFTVQFLFITEIYVFFV